MIVVEQLRARFGDFTVGPLSWHVPAGQYCVVLGPNGAGKSLLLGLLAGIHRADRGSIRFAGQDVTDEPAEKRRVGLVFQQSALFPHLSVEQNIAYGLVAHRVPRVERAERLASLISVLGIGPLLGRPVPTLSGGEAQRIALARALAIRPQILLLDEPLSPIDELGREALQSVLQSAHQAFGLTTVHVTHSRTEARGLADSCAVMLSGRLIQSGPTEAVFGKPRCSFVARFLGQPEGTAPECKESCWGPNAQCDQPVSPVAKGE